MAHTPEFLEVPVERVMTRRPDTVGAEAALADAAGLMVEGGYRHLPVVDPDGRLVGMLSERDLRARLGTRLEEFADAGRQLLADTVESAMQQDPITIGRRARIRDVLEVLVDDRIGALPVTDDAERLVGIVSYVDLLAYLREGTPALQPKRTRGPAPSRAVPRRRARGARKARAATGRAPRSAGARSRGR